MKRFGGKHWSKHYKRATKVRRTHEPTGEVFASLAEKNYFERTLLPLQKLGIISEVQRQVPFELVLPNGKPILTPTGKTSRYTADFVWRDEHGVQVVCDVKGFWSDESKLRMAVFEAIYDTKILVVKA